MNLGSDEFFDRLRQTFKIEADEHLQTIASCLLKLEKGPSDAEQAPLVAEAFRAAHSLKGAARAVDFGQIEAVCQSLEDLFASWKRMAPGPAGFDSAHRMLNAIAAQLGPTESSAGSPSPSRTEPDLSSPVDLPAPDVREEIFVAERKPAPGETVRISIEKLGARLAEAEEMLTVKLATHQRALELRELADRFAPLRERVAALEADAHALRRGVERRESGRASDTSLARLLDFFEWNASQLKSLENRIDALARTAIHDGYFVGKLVDDLLEESKKLLLLPFGTLSESFPKLVRDLCRDQGKEAELILQGEETEIDKRVLEEMKDPLIHLLRNGVDHGIEVPDERVRQGKPARARLSLAVTRLDDGKVEIAVSDDGAGIETRKVRDSAIRRHLVTKEEANGMGETALRELIFRAEVSTSPVITRLSGRGLGLAIVREKVEKLGGRVSVESKPGEGTCFRMVLPSTLATFRGILVETTGQLFVVPTFHVERVLRVRGDEIRSVEGHATIVVEERAIPLVPLSAILELPPYDAPDASAFTTVLILGAGEQRIAFSVDAVIGEQELLIKPLRKPLSRVRHIAGATVLGSGRAAPVLNVSDLLKSARNANFPAASAPLPKDAVPEADQKTILVAEDSITSRLLIKSIIESAGYRVKTAVDGMDAFTLLCAEEFDLVVSDVEMPRLNGFDLTARIRANRKLAELPVVLVTAMEKREDRERGVDVGANAYIVKSSFDQSDLLEAIRRLI